MAGNRPARPSIHALERAVASREHQRAITIVHALLESVDRRFGRLDQVELGNLASEPSTEERALVFSTRFISAFGKLVSDTDFKLTIMDFERLLLQHRWIDLMFEVSGFRSSDFLLAALAQPAGEGQWTFSGDTVLKLLSTFSLNSRHQLDFPQCWEANSTASGIAFLHYVGSRYLFWPRAFDLRERLLEWLPGYLDRVKLGSMTLTRIPEIYMHCSYAMTPRKHDIKANIMRQMHRACVESGCVEMPDDRAPTPGKKPTVVVIGEHLKLDHSVFRTHSKSVTSLREDFHVVGVVFPDIDGTPVEEFFDELLLIPKIAFFDAIREISVKIRERNPDIVYFTGVGMIPYMIALGALRMAPVQCVSFGHTATTMSPAIDYFILPDDFVGSTEVFSEKVLALPKEAMPFAPRMLENVAAKPAGDGKVRIAIPAATMKLNPHFFAALKQISERAKTPVEFHFLPLGSAGLVYVELSRAVKAQVPGVVVHMEAPFEIYLERMGACDFFLSPFPYGNMNSIMDAMHFSLPGVCLDGDEAHSHADVAIFRRIGFPEELCAKTVEDYVAAAVHLIDDPEWRKKCRQAAENCDFDAQFFKGDESIFAKALLGLVKEAPQKPAKRVTKTRRASTAPVAP